MTTEHIQSVVIGAGVVGLACAARLSQAGREVLVLERELAIGQGVSSRNSEVIHAGIYYPPGSLRARLCVAGKQRLYRYCSSRGVAASAIGKLIVATTGDEIPLLKKLALRARKNGVDDIEMLQAPQACAMQPGLSCVAALHSPSTGIVDSHQLMLSLQADLESSGGLIAFDAPVLDITHAAGALTLQIGGDSAMQLRTTELINCAGLDAVALARHTQGLEQASVPAAKFAKGNYFRLSGRSPFSKLIYPAPVAGGLGVHLTLDHSGQSRFGPDVEPLPDRNFNYRVDPSRADSFYAAIRRYWPALPDDSLVPDYAGVRPKIEREPDQTADFEISTSAHHGIPGLVNLFGIESPGLTASLAIADYVEQWLVATDSH